MRRDPLRNPADLISRVYAYAAYRLGPGPDAEDVTSETMLRAVKYRSTYDPAKGKPIAWLIGIARACADDMLSSRRNTSYVIPEHASTERLEDEVVTRLTVTQVVELLDERDRELVALRYGADLSTAQIATLLGMSAGAVDVALHRCRNRLRSELTTERASRRAVPTAVARPGLEPG
jgi:RNA polymerase sigma-70 factor (ECF subfamily)